MTRHILYDGLHRGYFVAVESHGIKYAAFFWKHSDAANWKPE